jgi:GTP-binding protein
MLKVALVGRPNVGKSSLFNVLLGYRRTIVLDEPGTTLDLIQEKVDWANLALIDSQGIYGEGDTKVLHQVIEAADVCLFMVDAIAGMTPFDEWIARVLHMSQKPVLLIINKCESKQAYDESDFSKLKFSDYVTVSVSHRTNIDIIKQWCAEKAGVATESKEPFIKLTLVGRPNTGKSTLMNRLCKREVSRVSPVALTTRDPVSHEFETEDGLVRIVDTAGMRRPRAKKETIETFSIQATTRAIRESDVVFLLINCSEQITDQDMRLLSLLEREGRPAAVLLNFWDVLSSTEKKEYIENSDFRNYLSHFVTQPISGKTGSKTDELLPLAKKLMKQANKRIKTSRLNEVVEKIIQRNPPPNAGRGNFNILYASQVRVDPPTFVFFMNRKRNLPESYQKYIGGALRENLGLKKQTIRVFFRGNDRD